MLIGAKNTAVLSVGAFDNTPPCSEAGLTTVARMSRRANTKTAKADAAAAAVAQNMLGVGQPLNGLTLATVGTGPSIAIPDLKTGVTVSKYGRSTGLTNSSIVGIDVEVFVLYENGGSCAAGPAASYTGHYINQIAVDNTGGSFAVAGDSGSLVFTKKERYPIGLVFAGTSQRVAAWVKRAQALGAGERIAAVDKTFGNGADVSKLYANTRVTDLNERRKMFEETPAQLRARNDALLNFALDLQPELEAWRQQEERRAGAVSRLRPAWRKAVIAHAGKPVAPDANLTLRVSIARVKGYEPRDGVVYTPRTTVGGMVDKYTGKDPFDLPKDVLQKARADDFGRWMDPALKDVPLDFLSDADTTGGNSGSPTVNGRGELVGANFDRVWENVANDFGYNPAVARNVNVDIRYMLWMLDRVKSAAWLLEQLGVRR